MNIKLSGNLARFMGYAREMSIDVEPQGTVKSVILKIISLHPDLRAVVLDGQGQVKKSFLVSLNGEKLSVDSLDVNVNNHDELDVFTAIAGG